MHRSMRSRVAGLIAASALSLVVASPAMADSGSTAKASPTVQIAVTSAAGAMTKQVTLAPKGQKSVKAHAAAASGCGGDYLYGLWVGTGITSSAINYCVWLRSQTQRMYSYGGRVFDVTVSYDPWTGRLAGIGVLVR